MVHKLKEFEKGVILVNKPPGITSFRVVARVRRMYSHSQGVNTTSQGCHCERSEAIPVEKEKGLLRGSAPRNDRQGPRHLKVGHTGTLDSMATGLLILLVGEATKRQGDFTKLPKEYEGEFVLGLESDTYSADGHLEFHAEHVPHRATRGRTLQPEILARLTSIKRAQVEIAFKKFLGEQEQTAPPFSAVQVNGERLHRLARRGRPLPELPRRKIRIESLELLGFHPMARSAGQAGPIQEPGELLNTAPRVRFRASVSSGTYIRSLVVDIGKELGTGAVLTQLTRTRIGHYSLSEAIDLPN